MSCTTHQGFPSVKGLYNTNSGSQGSLLIKEIFGWGGYVLYRERPSARGWVGTYLEEGGHGLVGAPYLDLEEGGLVAIAVVSRALDPLLLRVVPRAGSADDVLALPPRELRLRVDGLIDVVDVRARSALEPISPDCRRLRDGQDVGAVRTDWGDGGDRVESSC
jgi:hypothetical protein